MDAFKLGWPINCAMMGHEDESYRKLRKVKIGCKKLRPEIRWILCHYIIAVISKNLISKLIVLPLVSFSPRPHSPPLSDVVSNRRRRRCRGRLAARRSGWSGRTGYLQYVVYIQTRFYILSPDMIGWGPIGSVMVLAGIRFYGKETPITNWDVKTLPGTHTSP